MATSDIEEQTAVLRDVRDHLAELTAVLRDVRTHLQELRDIDRGEASPVTKAVVDDFMRRHDDTMTILRYWVEGAPR